MLKANIDWRIAFGACPAKSKSRCLSLGREESTHVEDTVKTRGLVLALFLLNALAGAAQVMQVTVKPLTEDDIKLIRQDVQSIKEDIIRDTMQFSTTEGSAFWPVYRQYAEEQRGIAEKRFSIIMEYVKSLDTMTDAQADDLTRRMLQAEDDTQSLRKKYLPKFESALSAKRAAKFYQVDNRLTMIVNVQLASEIPLIP